MKKLAWHFDFHSHKDVRIGHDPDPEGIAKSLAKAGVEEIITFSKCHNGFSYYPTTVGVAHPRMEGDPFGELLEACRRHEVKVLSYVSFGVDGEMGRQHPDWRQYHAPGECMESEDHFLTICPFTPYLDTNFLPQVKEIIELYQPDGFFFDTMSAFNPCYCQYCHAAYKEATGRPIPEDPEDADRGCYGAWRHERALEMIRKVGDFISALLPEAEVGFNQIGSPPYPEPMPASIRRLTLDFATSGSQSHQSSLSANFGSTAPNDSDIMPTRFNEGWGDWSQAPWLAIEQVSAPVLAYRERLYMGDRLHPANRLTHDTQQTLKSLAKLWERMERALPAEDVPRDPDLIVLHTANSMYGEDMRYFSVDARLRLERLNGIHRLLIDAGQNFAIVAEAYLETWLRPDRVLVLPEQGALSETTDALIRAHLAAGGQVLVIGRVPTVNGEAVDWLGVKENPEPWQDHVWLPWRYQAENLVLVRGDVHKLEMAGAESILSPFAPYDTTYGLKMGWGYNPPADERSTETSILTRHHVGAGTAWLLACPMCTDYARGINWQQATWLRHLWGMLPQRRQSLDYGSGSVEHVSYANESTSWCVLLNHAGEEYGPHGRMPWPRTLRVPMHDISVVLTDSKGRKPESVTVGDAPWQWSEDEGEVRLSPLSFDQVWQVIRVDWDDGLENDWDN